MIIIRNRYPNCEFVLVGDFNARTSDSPDFIDDTANLPGIRSIGHINEGMTSVRFTCDKEVNNYGKKLLELCKSTSLRICNGRVQPVMDTGNFTFISNMGSSVIDYVLVSHSLLSNGCIKNFKINHICFSDQIQLHLICPSYRLPLQQY